MKPVKNEKLQNLQKKPSTAEEWMQYFENKMWKIGLGGKPKNVTYK